MLWTYPEDLRDPSAPNALASAELASQILYSLSGRKYPGVKTTTEVYVCEHRHSGVRELMRESLRALHVTNHITFAGFGVNRMRLSGTPVTDVISVYLNGTELEISDYTVVNRNILEFTNCEFYSCFELTITYSYGVDPPEAGREAARVLANQFLEPNTDECGPNSNVRSISRQGIQYDIVNPAEALASRGATNGHTNGRTGVYEVDLWLSAVNPIGAYKRSRTFSPDTPRGMRRTV